MSYDDFAHRVRNGTGRGLWLGAAIGAAGVLIYAAFSRHRAEKAQAAAMVPAIPETVPEEPTPKARRKPKKTEEQTHGE